MRLSQFGPGTALLAASVGRVETGELHKIERKIALFPAASPIIDHERESFAVLIGPARITLSLVPDGSLNGLGNQRVFDGIE